MFGGGKRAGSNAGNGSRWVVRTQAEVAEFCGQSVKTVQGWASRMPGKPGQYDLGEIVRWLRTAGPWKPGKDDGLEVAEGEAAERYRQAKAALAELDLAERQHQLIDVEAARDFLQRWATVIKRAGERMRRKSPDSHRSLSDALAECKRLVDELRSGK